MYIIDSSYEIPDIEYMKNRAVGIMENGIRIRDVLPLYNKILESQNMAGRKMLEEYGIINPNSSQQILNYLQNVLTEDIVQACCSEDGKWTTKKSAMAELAIKGYQEAIDILTYRKAKKYAESVKSILDWVRGDGCIHPNVSFGKTNRTNCSEPAIMNIPKALLWDIIAPRKDGDILISIDIKYQEPWIMINMLGITMLKEILESGEGLYEAVFRKILDRDCTEIERAELKTSWNALTYGATIYGVRAMCRHIDGDAVYKFFTDIPEFKKYRGKCYGMSKKHIQEVSTYFGTKVRADEYGPKLSRVLMDIPIQGTGADILALLIKHFDDEMDERGLEDKLDIYYTRHDELIINADGAYAKEVGIDSIKEILADVIEHKVDDWEAFKVKIGVVEPGNIMLDAGITDDDEE